MSFLLVRNLFATSLIWAFLLVFIAILHLIPDGTEAVQDARDAATAQIEEVCP